MGTMIDRKLPLVFQMHSAHVDGPLLGRHHHLRLDHLVVGKGFGGQPTAPAVQKAIRFSLETQNHKSTPT